MDHTEETPSISLHPSEVAADAFRRAVAAAERGQQKLSETQALLSIAASFRQYCQQTDAALGDQQHLITLQTDVLELLERSAPQPIEGELLQASGGCCRQEANDADDLLEMGFGLICNADNAITSGGHLKGEWEREGLSFINRYNTRLVSRYGDQVITAEARDEIARHKAAEAEALAVELDERSAD